MQRILQSYRVFLFLLVKKCIQTRLRKSLTYNSTLNLPFLNVLYFYNINIVIHILLNIMLLQILNTSMHYVCPFQTSLNILVQLLQIMLLKLPRILLLILNLLCNSRLSYNIYRLFLYPFTPRPASVPLCALPMVPIPTPSTPNEK